MREGDKVDVLYVIGTGSVNDNNELRYSLRMLERNMLNVGRVIISGDIPGFVGGDAITVPCHDISPVGKHWNMLHKIVTGIREAKLDKPFMFSCDDHFITRQADALKWPVVNRGKVYTRHDWETINCRPAGSYQRAMAKTGDILRNESLPDTNVIWHGNMWIDPKYTDDVIAIAEKYRNECKYGFEPILLYNAFAIRESGVQPTATIPNDVKSSSFEKCMANAEKRGCFSTHDNAWRHGTLLNWMRENYGEKSRWEA